MLEIVLEYATGGDFNAYSIAKFDNGYTENSRWNLVEALGS
ncbi:hypothetical protein [Planococcus shenhongbingii]|uniref:Uncharacterized protein n=1 Tax=Planococcus shenhongbingii TaxID=3058398 RepID=A0ABT8NGJ8_9BACL|nr:hypothetical protein [Planococcus sp. N017]MDN7247030.1 hypothetical protein [Planococcus sp. N017]